MTESDEGTIGPFEDLDPVPEDDGVWFEAPKIRGAVEDQKPLMAKLERVAQTMTAMARDNDILLEHLATLIEKSTKALERTTQLLKTINA